MSCWMSSSRLHTTFTGSFDCLAMSAACSDEVELEPAPEAAAEQMIVDADLASGRAPASWRSTFCAMLGICVPTQISQPSGVTCTVQLIGSMVAWARNGFS